MNISQIGTRAVVTCARDASVRDLARSMRDRHVGDVVVVDEGEGGLVPVGIVTDRDLVVRVLAKGVDGDVVCAEDIMAAPLVTVLASEDAYDAIWHMRGHGIRRLPVVDAHGVLVGIVTADDLTAHFAVGVADMARIAPCQNSREQRAFASSAA